VLRPGASGPGFEQGMAIIAQFGKCPFIRGFLAQVAFWFASRLQNAPYHRLTAAYESCPIYSKSLERGEYRWRREWDSNPRSTSRCSTVFKFYEVRVIWSVCCYLVVSCAGFRVIQCVWCYLVSPSFAYNLSTNGREAAVLAAPQRCKKEV
jgi:hypothetical protein